MNQKAHSLLELLVVVAILCILVTIALYNYSGVLERVRDTLGM